MARQIIAMYADLQTAEEVTGELLRSGLPRHQIRVVEQRAVERYQQLATLSDSQRMESAAGGAGAGALAGAVGGVIVAILLAILPNVGWLLPAGPAATVLVMGVLGAGIGAMIGGVRGALSITDVPEPKASPRSRGVMVAVQVDEDDANVIANRMERFAPTDIDRSAKPWPSDHEWSQEARIPGSDDAPSRIEVLPTERPASSRAAPPRAPRSAGPQVLTFPANRGAEAPNPAQNRPLERSGAPPISPAGPADAPVPQGPAPAPRTRGRSAYDPPAEDAPEYYRAHFTRRFPGEDWGAYRRAYALGGELARHEERYGRRRSWREIEGVARAAWNREPHALPFERARRAIQHAYEEELRPGTLGTPIR